MIDKIEGKHIMFSNMLEIQQMLSYLNKNPNVRWASGLPVVTPLIPINDKTVLVLTKRLHRTPNSSAYKLQYNTINGVLQEGLPLYRYSELFSNSNTESEVSLYDS